MRIDPIRSAIPVAGAILLCACLVGARIVNDPPIADEVVVAAPAWNLAHNGFPGTTVVVEANSQWKGINRRTYNTLPGGILYLALWFAVSPANLLATRLAMAVWGPVLVAACFVFVRRVTGDFGLAILGTALFGLNYYFILGTAQARVDVMTASLGMAALASYCEVRLRSLNAAILLSSTLAVLACLTHPQGLQYLFCLVLLVCYFDRKSLAPVHLLLGALPFTICGTLWLCYVAQSPTDAFLQIRANSRGRLPDSWNPMLAVRHEIFTRYLKSASISHPWVWKFPLLAIPLGSIAGILLTRSLRRQTGLRAILLLTAGMLVGHTFFENYKFHNYLIHVESFYSFLVAALAVHAARAGVWQRVAAAAAVGTYLVINLGGVAANLRSDFVGPGFKPALSFLQSRVTPGDLVIGKMPLWFDCCGASHKLVDDPRLGVGSGLAPDYYVDQDYEIDWNQYKKEDPGLFYAIQQRRAQFDLVYDYRGYRIYHRR